LSYEVQSRSFGEVRIQSYHCSIQLNDPGNNGSNAILGNLTVSMPGNNENIISMQRFKGMTRSVTCSNNSIDIFSNDNTTFAYAQNVWDWVNGADNHTFVMVVGTGDCGWNEHRVPFTISALAYNDATSTASLTANASNWREAIHSYTLDVGAMPIPANARFCFK